MAAIKDLRELQGLTIEQNIMINEFYKKFNVNAVAGTNKKIINVEPFFYQGIIAGSEFLIYSINKMYIFLNIVTGRITLSSGVSISFYDELNAYTFDFQNVSAYWDGTALAVKIINGGIDINNIISSRIAVVSLLGIQLIGYRITLQ